MVTMMDKQIHNEDMGRGRERDKKWGLHISTAVRQWDRTEGPRMMDDGEMKGKRDENNNL